MTTQTTYMTTPADIEDGINFILKHVSGPQFPRTVMTPIRKQVQANSKEHVVLYFAESGFRDCRINAFYFSYLDFGLSWVPDLIFIDLDLERFRSKLGLDSALEQTLTNIKKHLQDEKATPTVLWSGRGYHVIQPLQFPKALEYIVPFDKYDKPSEQFLRFCKDFLSDDMADKGNYPSFRSCLLRVPGTFNSKNGSKVKILQKWNGKRQRVPKSLILEFDKYLRRNEIDQMIIRCSIEQNRKNTSGNFPEGYYEWITKLLDTPLEAWRKRIIDLILGPYLIVVKKMKSEESFKIIRKWLDKCNTLKTLDRSVNYNSRIKTALKNAANKQIGPMSQEKIKVDATYIELYNLLKSKGVLT